MKESVRRDFWRTIFFKHVWKIEFLAGVAWSVYAFIHGKHERTDIGGITLLGSFSLVFLVFSIDSLQHEWARRIVMGAPPQPRGKNARFTLLDAFSICGLFLGAGMILGSVEFAAKNFAYCILLNVWGIYLLVFYSATSKRILFSALRDVIVPARMDEVPHAGRETPKQSL